MIDTLLVLQIYNSLLEGIPDVAGMISQYRISPSNLISSLWLTIYHDLPASTNSGVRTMSLSKMHPLGAGGS